MALYFEKKSIAVIEEPERNVHPHLVSRITAMMKEASRQKQIIVTSHNPEVIRNADTGDVLLVSRNSEGFSTISRPAEREDVKVFLQNEMGWRSCSPRTCCTLEMPYTRLYLLVEGDDDERFANRVVIPQLRSRYDDIQVWQYAQRKLEKVNVFLRSIKAMGADYFLLADIDEYSCFPKKRAALLEKFTELGRRQTVVVLGEIESWYLAGLPNENRWGLGVPADTTNVTKEQFDAAMPKPLDSRIGYMVEILKLFDVNTAAARNPSFQYFARRCGLLG